MKKFVALSTAVLASGSVMASDFTTQIGTAVTDSTGNVTAVITGIITVAAVGFGAGMLVKWLNR